MKKYFITYNIAFLLIGNILFSSIHHLDEHTHSGNQDECTECLYFENNSNYIFYDQEISYLNNNPISIFLNDLVSIESKISKRFQSRAPPAS